MASNDSVSSRSFWGELLVTAIYKRNQGRMVRQATCLALWIACLIGSWRLYDTVMMGFDFGDDPIRSSLLRWSVPALVFIIGFWCSYRVVNWPTFADFLISVEAELNKVSWPSWPELYRAAIVVIFTMFFLAMLLFGYDLIWTVIFEKLGVS